MSGFPGMENWYEYWKAGRDHIRRLTGGRRDAASLTNTELSKRVQDVILSVELDSESEEDLIEAAKRLSTIELETIEHGRLN